MSAPYKLEFDVPLDIAIERLSSKVKTFSFSSYKHQGMMGKVSKNGAMIFRNIPYLRNPFKPILFGSFEREGDKTIFFGSFRIHRFGKVFMTIWFGFFILSLLLSLSLVTSDSKSWAGPFEDLVFIISGIGFIKFGKWFSAKDKDWILENLESAINCNS